MAEVYDIAIIGGGPGGIGAAVESAALGIENVVVFEKSEQHNATIRQFYKDGKRVDKDYKGQVVDLKGSIAFVDGTKESTLELFDKLIATQRIHYKTDI